MMDIKKMRSTVKGTNLFVTESLQEYLRKKIFQALERRLKSFSKKDAIIIDCELSRDTMHHKKGEVFRAEVNITIPPRNLLRAEATADNIRSAIDFLEKEVLRECEKYKEKVRMASRRKIRLVKMS